MLTARTLCRLRGMTVTMHDNVNDNFLQPLIDCKGTVRESTWVCLLTYQLAIILTFENWRLPYCTCPSTVVADYTELEFQTLHNSFSLFIRDPSRVFEPKK